MKYIISGDTEEFKGCLVYVCGSSFESAQKYLNRMLNNPTENDKKLILNMKNLYIEEVDEKECWWDNV